MCSLMAHTADGGQSEEMRALLAEAQAAWTDEDIDKVQLWSLFHFGRFLANNADCGSLLFLLPFKLMHDLRENGMLRCAWDHHHIGFLNLLRFHLDG